MVPTLATGLLLTETVVQVTAAYGQSAFLTADGLLFVCGNGEAGQPAGCTCVRNAEGGAVPTLVLGGLQGRKVLQVAAGTSDTVCVTQDGAVFAFGYGCDGQLGTGDTEGRMVPTRMKGWMQKKSVVQVAAGDGLTMCVTQDGRVFACGANYVGQLGVGGTACSASRELEVSANVSYRAAARQNSSPSCSERFSRCLWHSRWLVNYMGIQRQRSAGCRRHRRQTGANAGHRPAGQTSRVRRSREHHTICSTTEGAVFTWGSHDCGKLGLGNVGSLVAADKLVPPDRGEGYIAKESCGASCSW